MDTEHKEYVKQEWERVNSLVDTLTLFDDELMGRVFDKNTQATELVLRLILGRNIKVISEWPERNPQCQCWRAQYHTGCARN